MKAVITTLGIALVMLGAALAALMPSHQRLSAAMATPRPVSTSLNAATAVTITSFSFADEVRNLSAGTVP